MGSKGNCKVSVLKYLTNQNRPYSANDVVQNLHKEFGKTAIQKALDDLTADGKIREKVYGKQKVYSIIQDEVDNQNAQSSELLQLDTKIEDLSEKLKEVEQELKQTEGCLKELESQPTTEHALTEKQELEKTIKTLNDKINVLSQSTIKISEEEKNKIRNDCEKYTKEYKKRKRICMDIVNSILENYPKKMKVLFEEIGIEVNESDNIAVK